jgi:gamma-glutamyl hercynylcysteine S-oxide synthase
MEPSPRRLAERLAAVRERTMALVRPVDDEGLTRRAAPIMSPPAWDLGHIAAYEELWLVCRLGGGTGMHPELASLYDAAETPRAIRTAIPILDPPAARAYMAAVRERALEELDRADLGEDGPPLTAGGLVFEMVVEHEAQHAETMLQALQMLPAGGYRPAGRARTPPGPAALPRDAVHVEGGTFEMGAGGAGFAYDCERPRHRRAIAPFLIDRHPVTNARHLEFMADGGYARRELWSDEGWAWRESEGAEAPAYWERDGEGGWLVRSFDEIAPPEPERPVCHVSWYEADAHARWAGARLPTEAEWERAAGWDAAGGQRALPWGGGPDAARANVGQLAFAPAAAGTYPGGAAPCGAEQMLGDVWEWTSTPFDAYPGFRAFPYREYAVPFFGSRHRVLRGGSWATQAVAARTTFRNWDLPERRQVVAGFRLAHEIR